MPKMRMCTVLSGLFLGLIGSSFAWAGLSADEAEGSHRKMPVLNVAFRVQAARSLARHQATQREADRFFMERGRKAYQAERAKLPQEKVQQVRLEGDYILAAQFWDPSHPAHGAINNVNITNLNGDDGRPDWVVPRENALAILALLTAYETTGNKDYRVRAEAAADYLLRVQDADGGWFDQYNYTDPTLRSKSPTQTAEVMMALSKLGYSSARYEAMKKGAQFLMSLQDPANKGGADDGLIGGGLKGDGTFHTWRWSSDNSFAYLALENAKKWAVKAGERTFSRKLETSAKRILTGINEVLYVDDPSDPDYGVWRRAVDESGAPVDPTYHEWINYAPQMLDLPAVGVGSSLVGEWIHRTLQKADGAVVWDDRWFSERRSPGFTFQAILVWQDLGQMQYITPALQWADASGLKSSSPDPNGIAGSWVDWVEPSGSANWWERFIDTSFYWVSVLRGGYDFRK